MMLRSTRAASQLLQRLLRHAAASSETAAALWPQQQQQQQHTTNDTTPLLLAGWPLGLWQGSDASSRPASLAACVRGLASVSTPALHAGCGHNHDHDHGCVDAVTTQIRATQDMQQLQQLVQQGSGRFTASQAAAAYRQAATLAGSSPAAAAPVVGLLAPAWPALLPQASGSDLAWTLLAWTKLHLGDERLWAATLAAVPGQVPTAAGQDLANICYALAATSEANGGSVPGVPQAQVKELLQRVTHEVVSLVSGAPAGDGCGASAASRKVSVGNLASVRWAHELMEELCGEQQPGGGKHEN